MMIWKLKRRLSKISQQAQPEAQLKLEMRRFFQDKGYFAAPPQPLRSFRLVYATAGLAIVLVVLGGTASYAYASDEVLPDTPLYPVRQQLEAIEDHLAITPVQKQQVQQKHKEKRLQEAKLLVVKKKPLPVVQAQLLLEEKKEVFEQAKKEHLISPAVEARLRRKGEREDVLRGKGLLRIEEKKEDEKSAGQEGEKKKDTDPSKEGTHSRRINMGVEFEASTTRSLEDDRSIQQILRGKKGEIRIEREDRTERGRGRARDRKEKGDS